MPKAIFAIILAAYAWLLIEQSNSQRLEDEEERLKQKDKFTEIDNKMRVLRINLNKEQEKCEALNSELESMKQLEFSSKEEALRLKEWGQKSQEDAERLKQEIKSIKEGIDSKDGESRELIPKNKQLDSQKHQLEDL